MSIKNVTVAGSGVLGFQIAFQTAFHGFKVSVYDISDEVLEKAKAKFQNLAERYTADIHATQQQIDATFTNLSYTSDLAESVKDADLLIEAVPELPEIKIEFYKKLAGVAPEKTIFATNSSTLLPSQFSEFTGRPAKFIALHFANEIWKYNTAEIMGHPGTSSEVFDTLVAFAKSIGMVALPVYKEQPGYIINSLLVPLINEATQLWANEVSDYKTIDKTWMIATGAPKGPFGFIDMVGINTAYNVTKMTAEREHNPVLQKVAELFKNDFINKGKLGAATGEGFYKHPNPEYLEPDFLK
ncbi:MULTISPECIES: 3-hydroxyacyl-CoA dehydrogenase [Chryseobacterium]|uniref:3-hydroxyacyl-CoA dehydrogenase n=1 Tax=Chryseobacterium camelliae TaxID=1265445 RepID=A0ABU0TFQ1_9FLAO|nr:MULTISPECIES: 3-hydroxyacyl-CoA dehydrogenase [Chryseobacterium]MDT3406310.1 3-hydroxyacyl-CoA dehydrogenase [Pseudacidovorax intermedius]MDQ1095891.1 3-hydroxyacyl-CoA dehydrogenase [Chryseobacterium camelliae]MDQ1099828.1 3-hydroxyacyl-CoA dehydrogenase [Chryseobacterium sp. SORGH_AS_1048]MDR6087174.1 3-hydroxyacyl-CoA dehydrogenase [Chryseobacterium sp. SORGH_AS_0909]MDR6131547.1 3-hydroxyacyl-CoA dehydrogenase [Chryseobacterium sp. SORGH_AS_1175]